MSGAEQECQTVVVEENESQTAVVEETDEPEGIATQDEPHENEAEPAAADGAAGHTDTLADIFPHCVDADDDGAVQDLAEEDALKDEVELKAESEEVAAPTTNDSSSAMSAPTIEDAFDDVQAEPPTCEDAVDDLESEPPIIEDEDADAVARVPVFAARTVSLGEDNAAKDDSTQAAASEETVVPTTDASPSPVVGVNIEDAVVDIEAEPHAAIKVLNEEAEHEACMPDCFQAKSASTPTMKSVEMSELDVLVKSEDASEVTKSGQDDTPEPPKARSLDDSIAQDDAVAAVTEKRAETLIENGRGGEEKLASTVTSVPSLASTTEGKRENSSDVDTNSSDHEKRQSVDSASGVRTFQVLAVPPQDLLFDVPPGCKPGDLVWVQGPHGPLQVQAPAHVKPGHRVAVRLAPPLQHRVVVPSGGKPGQTVTFPGEHHEKLHAIIPPGKNPGDVFYASPPVAMLCVPDGAIAGDQLAFKVPTDPQAPKGNYNLTERMTTVPPNMAPGQYFATMICDISQPQSKKAEMITEIPNVQADPFLVKSSGPQEARKVTKPEGHKAIPRQVFRPKSQKVEEASPIFFRCHADGRPIEEVMV